MALLAAFGLLSFCTGTALAGVASVDGTVITFEAKRGEVNDVRAEPQPASGVLLTDASAPLEAGSGCAAAAGGVLCPYPGGTEPRVVELRLGDRDDRGSIDDGPGALAEMLILGARGADSVSVSTGASAHEVVDGGPGDDAINSSTNFVGDTRLRGGAGRDDIVASNPAGVLRVQAGRGADRLEVAATIFKDGTALDAGRGNDTILFGGVFSDLGGALRFFSAGRGFDTLDLAQVRFGVLIDLQTCPGSCEVERVIGSPSNDTLLGDAGWTRFDAGAGDDTINPGPGFDTVFAGDGNDQLSLVDGAFDMASCGADEDTATGDRRDLIFHDCETVTRGTGSAPPAP